MCINIHTSTPRSYSLKKKFSALSTPKINNHTEEMTQETPPDVPNHCLRADSPCSLPSIDDSNNFASSQRDERWLNDDRACRNVSKRWQDCRKGKTIFSLCIVCVCVYVCGRKAIFLGSCTSRRGQRRTHR